VKFDIIFRARPDKTVDERRRVAFIAGVVLIAVSFLVYPAYPLIIVFLPYSVRMKVNVIVGLSLLSWIVFGAGIFLAGFEGYEYLKELCKRKPRGGKSE
jgi:hypothetical protein